MTADEVRLDAYRHKHLVSLYMNIIIEQLGTCALDHDNSKLDDFEAYGYAKFIPMLREVKYGSDEYKKIIKDMDEITSHHYANNSHHPEYHKNGISDMGLIDIIEMLVDWKVASIKSDTSFEESTEINQKRFGFSDELKRILLNTEKGSLMLDSPNSI